MTVALVDVLIAPTMMQATSSAMDAAATYIVA